MPDLRAAAEAAKNNPWHAGKVINRETLEFTRLATPEAILELYAKIDRLKSDLDRIDDYYCDAVDELNNVTNQRDHLARKVNDA